jgi:hypothetical protein
MNNLSLFPNYNVGCVGYFRILRWIVEVHNPFFQPQLFVSVS